MTSPHAATDQHANARVRMGSHHGHDYAVMQLLHFAAV
jgi:hypothetical protein